MAQVIKDGKVYTIYEMCPRIEPSQVELLADQMKSNEKRFREKDWKQRARKGYRKK